ncbi:MAG: EAL domain-containing protein, partial [Gammaproteobacteria bacterium]|nr:EAL domain-containing protein [Gammaproteobacteria bacterium]
DDFGTGYSSLSYLSRFPLDVLKIDRSFISALTGERKGARIVNAILSLAQELELDVVAEGIEQHEEAQWLRERGCAYGQGYLFGRPLRLPEAIIQLPRLFR